METILVLGGTGKTGRRVARRLRAAGHTARIASRTGAFPFDLGAPDGWAAALDGITAAYLVEPDLRGSTDHGARIPRLVRAAAAAGARRLVLLSAPRAGEDGHPLHLAEEAVRASGAGWTVLRPDWFAQNFSEGPWLPGIRDGALVLPTGSGRTPFVDAEDIAEVAVAALTEDRHTGHVYDLTGPRAIGFGEATALIGAATGRPVRHVDVEPEVFVERQTAHGVPPDVARLLTGLLTDIREGRGAEPADGVRRALGREATPFEDFVATAFQRG